MAKGFVVIFLLLISSLAANAYESEFQIFDVHKNFPLREGQKVYHDYYVNMGTENGVQTGDKLNVFRKVPVTDPYHNRAQADLLVNVGKLKVIQAQKTMCVARLELSRGPAQNNPVVHYDKVMQGDRVELIGKPHVVPDDEEDDEETSSN